MIPNLNEIQFFFLNFQLIHFNKILDFVLMNVKLFQTVVLLHTWIAGLNEENFVDADKCMPDRWISPPSPHSPLLVAPFGVGRRICPGKRFVEQAIQLILAKVTIF